MGISILWHPDKRVCMLCVCIRWVLRYVCGCKHVQYTLDTLQHPDKCVVCVCVWVWVCMKWGHGCRLALFITMSLYLQRIDFERARTDALDPQLRHKPRLIADEELPAWLLRDEEEVRILLGGWLLYT